MTVQELDAYFRTFLDIDRFSASDDSLNGLQAGNTAAEVTKIVFAVDASLECFERAKAAGAQMVFVHHGLFWGKPVPVTGVHYNRLSFLIENKIALYACHLPLDAAPEVGNNAVLARALGITAPEPFGLYHGKKIGFKGALEKPLTIDEAVKKISFMDRPPSALYPYGKERSKTAAVISGGAAFEVFQAIDEGVDLYVTGEPSHSVAHSVMEAKVNMIAGGHYNTEVYGVRAVMQKVEAETGLAAEFIDLPTGL